MIYVFGDCALDTDLYALHRAGHSIQLRPKVFQVLTYLLVHRERVVSRQELCAQVWPDQFISDAALESAIRRVRQAIGDSGRAQQLIQTRHGHGYRFIAAVTVYPDARSGRDVEGALPPPAPATKPAQDRTDAIPPPVPPAVSAHAALPSPPDDAAQMLPCPDALAGERKIATILGCSLVHDPALRDRLGLDTLHSLMRVLYGLARNEVHRYGGTLQHMAGDRFIALFGVPMAQEDHARRAVLAALALLQRVSAQRATHGSPPGDPLAVRMGLHTGLVAVGGVGDEAEVAAAVVGDTATLAAALQEHAEPGTILVSDTTARLVQRLVEVEALGPVPVGEQRMPVVAHKVLGIRPQRAPVALHVEQSRSRFVGRDLELTTLQALLAGMEDGQGHVVGVVGDPGIGKSRLLDEFRRRLNGRRLTYLRGRCLSYGSATPYFLVLDLLRHNCGLTELDSSEAIIAKVQRALQEVGMAPDEWAPYLLPLLGLEAGADQQARLNPQAIKARTFETLVQMSVNGSRQRPLVLEIEDLQWIDATSEEWLAALVERMAGAPILALVTYRSGYRPRWVEKSYATQLALQRLTPGESRQVLQAVLPPEQVPEALTQEILAKADGNPFFLEELARTVVEQDDRRLPLDVPDTIHTVLAARIDRLPAAEKRLLQTAAVIGKDVTLPLLQALAVLPEEELRGGLRSLQAAEFFYETRLVPEPTYTFKHVLTQEVAYQSLLQRTREQYHQQLARVVEARFPEIAGNRPEWLAHHYTAAGLPGQAIPCWRQAGQRAVEHSAYAEAISHLTNGLEVLKTMPDTVERQQQEIALQSTLGVALMTQRGYADPDVGHAYERARALCQQMEDTPRRFPVLWGLWVFYFVRGELHTGRELGEQLLGLAHRVEDPGLLLEAHLALGSNDQEVGKVVTARAHLEQALALFDPQQHRAHAALYGQDPQLMGCAILACVLWVLGYPDQAWQRSHEALMVAQTVDHAYSQGLAHFFAALLARLRRDLSATAAHTAAVLTLAQKHAFQHLAAIGLLLQGWAVSMQGQAAAGIAQLRQGLEAYQALGASISLPHFLALLAEVCGQVGQTTEGLALLDEALAIACRTDDRWWEAELSRLQGILLWRRSSDHTAEAEACFQKALAIARRQQAKSWELRAAMSLSHLWQQQGKRAEAHELLAPIYGWFTEGFDTADLQEAKALLGDLS
jgi:predicted ATPase/class 3 adenylate cyclase/DNA-binding winged helix-turn-helix (wHTH) protein